MIVVLVLFLGTEVYLNTLYLNVNKTFMLVDTNCPGPPHKSQTFERLMGYIGFFKLPKLNEGHKVK